MRVRDAWPYVLTGLILLGVAIWTQVEQYGWAWLAWFVTGMATERAFRVIWVTLRAERKLRQAEARTREGE